MKFCLKLVNLVRWSLSRLNLRIITVNYSVFKNVYLGLKYDREIALWVKCSSKNVPGYFKSWRVRTFLFLELLVNFLSQLSRIMQHTAKNHISSVLFSWKSDTMEVWSEIQISDILCNKCCPTCSASLNPNYHRVSP